MDGTATNAAALKRERLSVAGSRPSGPISAPRSRRLYHGWAHVALIYAIGGAAIWYCARHPRLAVLVRMAGGAGSFLGANVFEWWIHKYVMHRPLKGSWASTSGIPWRTTSSSPRTSTTIDNARDFRIVFFPPYALITFLAMSLVPALLLQAAGFPDAGWLY